MWLLLLFLLSRPIHKSSKEQQRIKSTPKNPKKKKRSTNAPP
jgi:hypothetical protein